MGRISNYTDREDEIILANGTNWADAIQALSVAGFRKRSVKQVQNRRSYLINTTSRDPLDVALRRHTALVKRRKQILNRRARYDQQLAETDKELVKSANALQDKTLSVVGAESA